MTWPILKHMLFFSGKANGSCYFDGVTVGAV